MSQIAQNPWNSSRGGISNVSQPYQEPERQAQAPRQAPAGPAINWTPEMEAAQQFPQPTQAQQSLPAAPPPAPAPAATPAPAAQPAPSIMALQSAATSPVQAAAGWDQAGQMGQMSAGLSNKNIVRDASSLSALQAKIY